MPSRKRPALVILDFYTGGDLLQEWKLVPGGFQFFTSGGDDFERKLSHCIPFLSVDSELVIYARLPLMGPVDKSIIAYLPAPVKQSGDFERLADHAADEGIGPFVLLRDLADGHTLEMLVSPDNAPDEITEIMRWKVKDILRCSFRWRSYDD